MADIDDKLHIVGTVISSLEDRASAPRQGDEGAPDAVIKIATAYERALRGLEVGNEILVLTWLDRADRGVLEVHPRDENTRPLTGVFATRSPDRPNPIGLHRVTITSLVGNRIGIRPMEALNGTLVLDIKPLLGSRDER